MFMSEISREQLHAYLDDALSDAETARVEQALRDSETLRRSLQQAMQERDRGEHSLGAVWRRERLTCPSREQLGSYLLQVLDEGEQNYLDFHLHTIGCAYCVANLGDLQALQQEPPPKARERRRRFFQSSAGYLQVCRETKNDETPRR
jgi:DNA-binding phage protein